VLHGKERVLPLKEGKKEGNNALLIQQIGLLFGRNVVIKSLNVVISRLLHPSFLVCFLTSLSLAPACAKPLRRRQGERMWVGRNISALIKI